MIWIFICGASAVYLSVGLLTMLACYMSDDPNASLTSWWTVLTWPFIGRKK